MTRPASELEWLEKLARILKRDFERTSHMQVSDVWWPEDTESIVVVADGKAFIQECGSDDDGFTFVGRTRTITVQFSDEWLKLNEEPPE